MCLQYITCRIVDWETILCAINPYGLGVQGIGVQFSAGAKRLARLSVHTISAVHLISHPVGTSNSREQVVRAWHCPRLCSAAVLEYAQQHLYSYHFILSMPCMNVTPIKSDKCKLVLFRVWNLWLNFLCLLYPILRVNPLRIIWAFWIIITTCQFRDFYNCIFTKLICYQEVNYFLCSVDITQYHLSGLLSCGHN